MINHLYIFSFFFALLVRNSHSNDAESHIQKGNKFLASGQFSDALSHYHLAIQTDSTNYMTYFRRATVYLAMGKSKSALPDLDQVLLLKPDFNAARQQRANVKLKQGKLDEAQKDYEDILLQDPSHQEAQQQLSLLPTLHHSFETAKQMVQAHDWQAAIHYITPVIEACVWDASLYEMRAEYFLNLGDVHRAIQDLRPTTKLQPDNTKGHLKLSHLNYDLGDVEESLKEIRECLKLDSDHKECHKHYKHVKKVSKSFEQIQKAVDQKDWAGCIEQAGKTLKLESQVQAVVHKIDSHFCTCYTEEKQVELGMEHCNKVIVSNPQDIDALCNRGDLYILDEQFEKAVDDFQTADSINDQLRRVKEGLKRAQKLLKQSKKRDYYKILGVKRTANKREISKAYRKLAQKWHPDKYQEGEEKQKAEKMFIDIAAAKEVLTDPEKRQKFDQGEDPLDPETQQGQQWHEGFNPFGHGGFQFKFHFG